MNNSISIIIKDVFYSSKLRESQISIAIINDNKYDILFKSNGLIQIKNNNNYIIAKRQKKGNLFYIDIKLKQMNIIIDYIFKVDITKLSLYILQYLRTSYLRFKNLQKI